MEDKLFLKALEVLCEKIVNLQNSLDVSEYFLEKAKKELEDIKKNMLVDKEAPYNIQNGYIPEPGTTCKFDE